MELSALLAPLLPEDVRYDDRARAGLMYLVDKLEALAARTREG